MPPRMPPPEASAVVSLPLYMTPWPIVGVAHVAPEPRPVQSVVGVWLFCCTPPKKATTRLALLDRASIVSTMVEPESCCTMSKLTHAPAPFVPEVSAFTTCTTWVPTPDWFDGQAEVIAPEVGALDSPR